MDMVRDPRGIHSAELKNFLQLQIEPFSINHFAINSNPIGGLLHAKTTEGNAFHRQTQIMKLEYA